MCMYDIYNELFQHIIPTIIIHTVSVGVDQSLLLTWTKYVRYVHQELVTPGGWTGPQVIATVGPCCTQQTNHTLRSPALITSL